MLPPMAGFSDAFLRGLAAPLGIAAAAIGLALVLGIAASIGLWRLGTLPRRAVLVISAILLLAASALKMPFDRDVALALPTVILMLSWRLGSLDPVLLSAAAASGAAPARRLTLVVLPWIWPTALAAAAMSLAACAMAFLLQGFR